MVDPDRDLRTIGYLAALWATAGVVGYMLLPHSKPKRLERLCGYHMASVNRRNNLTLLDSHACEICKDEEVANV